MKSSTETMEIAVVSGKGGTGKSSISAAFATLINPVMLADCDVDAANLYLIFNPQISEEEIYVSGQKAVIDSNLCKNCGLCYSLCQFDAVVKTEFSTSIDEISCDGCKLCARECPNKAITMFDIDKSRMYSGSISSGKMVYGKLAPGEENSGKLVNLVREKAKNIAKFHSINHIIIDGPPGIGCPVISSLTGVDIAVIVTEPSLSGLSDLKRTIEICNKLNLNTKVIINKYDINLKGCQDITNYCRNNNTAVVGKIPFSHDFVGAMIACKSIIAYAPQSLISKEIAKIFKEITS